jgi:hypothetical protein
MLNERIIERLQDWAIQQVSNDLSAGRGDPVQRGTAAYYLREVKRYGFTASNEEVNEACKRLKRKGY